MRKLSQINLLKQSSDVQMKQDGEDLSLIQSETKSNVNSHFWHYILPHSTTSLETGALHAHNPCISYQSCNSYQNFRLYTEIKYFIWKNDSFQTQPMHEPSLERITFFSYKIFYFTEGKMWNFDKRCIDCMHQRNKCLCVVGKGPIC